MFKIFLPKPRLNPRLGAQFLIQLADGGFVIAGMAEEDAKGSVRGCHRKDYFSSSRISIFLIVRTVIRLIYSQLDFKFAYIFFVINFSTSSESIP